MADAQSLITDNIDVWTTAIKKRSATGRGSNKKIELTGIKKLRELILELAVRGKLVPQDPNDEPASVLLEKIAAEKAQLIKDKKIKKTKTLPEISEDEKPFELPDGWEWVRLGECGNIFNGNSINARLKEQKYTGVEGLPFVATKDVGYGFDLLNYDNGIAIPLNEPKFKVAHKGAILICAEGGSAGKKCGLIDRDICFGNKLFANELFGGINSRYILSVYLTPMFYDLFNQSMTGIIGGISTAKFVELIVPIAPLTEQHRIVTKVDELMVLCDQLEQQTENSITAHKTLVETLLATLTNSENAEAFNQNWTRIAEHFDTLFTTEHSIDQLIQTVLQLAVMGKLVPQNPNDEPASVLLEKIAAEKEQLIKDKKIKKQKVLPTISEDEKSFELPNGWEWVILQNITSKITDGDHQTPPRISSGYKLLSAKNVRDGYLDMNNCDFIAEEHYIKSRERCLPECGDLLIVSVGGTIGRSSVVPVDSEFALVRSVALIKPMILNSYYFKYAMDSKLLQDSIHSRKRGGAQPCLYLSEIGKFPFSLPPLTEQHRIVKKVDELMNLFDQIKVRLNDAQTTQLQLAETIVEQAVN